jgi:hypothetical protein
MSSHNPFANAYPVGGIQWTEAEDAKLLDMLAAKRNYRDISSALGRRSVAACKCRAHQIRLGLNRKYWTAQETELAEKLIAENASEEACQAMLGRSRQACADRLRRAKDSFGNAERSGFIVEQKISIPPQVLEDRNRRLMAQKSLTAVLMGDPEENRRRL